MDDVFEVSAPAQPDGDDPFAAAPPADFGSEPMPQFEAPSDMGSFEPPADVPAFETPAEPTDAPVFEAAPVPDMGGMGMPDMGGGMPDMGGGMMGGGMPDMGGGMPDMGGGMPDMGGGMGGMGSEFMAAGELSPLAKWKIEQQEKLAQKAAASDAALQQRLSEASEALNNFYAERTELTTKRATENRAAEAAYVQERDAAMIADSWESVCKLVDLKGPEKPVEKDTSRMRGLLVQLKHV